MVHSTSRAFNELTETAFRELTQQMTFMALSIKFGVDIKTVSLRARQLKVIPHFSRKSTNPLSEEDRERIFALRKEGKSFCNIGKELNRCSSHVTRVYEKEVFDIPDKRKAENKTPSLPWPEIETNAKLALGERRYDDVPRPLIEREWPSYRKAIDARFVSMVSRFSTTGCAAHMCFES